MNFLTRGRIRTALLLTLTPQLAWGQDLFDLIDQSNVFATVDNLVTVVDGNEIGGVAVTGVVNTDAGRALQINFDETFALQVDELAEVPTPANALPLSSELGVRGESLASFSEALLGLGGFAFDREGVFSNLAGEPFAADPRQLAGFARAEAVSAAIDSAGKSASIGGVVNTFAANRSDGGLDFGGHGATGGGTLFFDVQVDPLAGVTEAVFRLRVEVSGGLTATGDGFAASDFLAEVLAGDDLLAGDPIESINGDIELEQPSGPFAQVFTETDELTDALTITELDSENLGFKGLFEAELVLEAGPHLLNFSQTATAEIRSDLVSLAVSDQLGTFAVSLTSLTSGVAIIPEPGVFTAVPEPSSIALLTLTATIVAACRRSQHRFGQAASGDRDLRANDSNSGFASLVERPGAAQQDG